MSSEFKMNKLAAALGVALAAGSGTQVAQAVNVAQDGIGEVLLYPIYTVRNGFDTYLNIVNTGEDTVMFKIHFLEGENSRECLDFNVILSPYDVWTATISYDADVTGPAGGGIVKTRDHSCTAPVLGLLPDPLGIGDLRGQQFFWNDFTGARNDTGTQDLDRCRVGYVEVIEMGVSPTPNEDIMGTVAYNAYHINKTGGNKGVPRNCNAIVSAFNSNLGGIQDEFNEPENVLMGSGTLINVDSGKASAINPTVLANFYNPDIGSDFLDGASSNDLVNLPASLAPFLDQVEPANAQALFNSAGTSNFRFDNNFARDVEAVAAILAGTAVLNQFDTFEGTNAQTDWAVTFPTKNFFVDTAFFGGNPDPFEFKFQGDGDGNGLSCVTVDFRYFDREELEPDVPPDLGFSPPQPGTPPSSICYEVNILTFNNSDLLGELATGNLGANVNTKTIVTDLTQGWMRLEFVNAGQFPSVDGTLPIQGDLTWRGLPVIGGAFQSLENGVSLIGNVLNYMWYIPHGVERDISPYVL
ncbi:MAG: hypothetical protein KDG50_04320 [Chromatiales bacterium]|nr:hypothetical protein [Chromatiales bacterium]